MRKLMASTIIILPLLLLAILLVNGAILSLVTHIYVENVEFSKKDAVVFVMDNPENPPKRNIMDEINVFPTNAKNRDLVFKSSNENVATVDEEGVVTPVFYGETYITVQSKENVAALAKRKIVVTGTTIYDFELNEFPTDMYVGERAQLSVNVFPVDALNKAQKWESDRPDILKVNANGTVTAVGVGQAKITVTALGNEDISKTVTINCHARKVDGFKVFCADKEIQNAKEYKTFLDSLTFEVSNGQKTITYQTNNAGDWQQIQNGTLTVDIAKVHDISFKSGGETISFSLEKADLDSFDMDVFATLDAQDGAKTITLDSIEKANEEDEILIMLAKNVQDSFTLQVNLDEDIIGGFGSDENFAEMLKIEEVENYQASYDSLNNQIIISFPGLSEFQQDISLKFAEKEMALKLKRIAISQVEFTNETESFDNGNTEDIYKGYQQVTVYAKQSSYDGELVDYFKIPFNALSSLVDQKKVNPEEISWNLTRIVGNDTTQIITNQLGYDVTYNNLSYTIEKDEEGYVLKDQTGAIVVGEDGKNPQKIIWVDVFSEPGYARIYFGAFAGLSESDVQNNYFGNFAEEQNWTQPNEIADDDSGREFAASPNAFSFLRVEAGDGAVGGTNRHFNFNVLDDESLVNVFDADGYYGNDKVVLQTDFYGVGELGESDEKFDYATENGLFLTKVDGLGKTTIYGNGHQVNFEAKNASMTGSSESEGIAVNRAYNAVIKCSNPVETISAQNQKMVLKMTYAYYCNLSYYYKFRPEDAVFYTKNTVFFGASKAGIQLYKAEQSLYVENIVMVECSTGILVDDTKNGGQDVKIYFKGSADILNYANKTTLNNFNSWVEMVYGLAVPNIGPYFEWYGLNQTAAVSTKDIDNFYVNVLVFAVSDLGDKVFVWDGNEYALASEKNVLDNGAKIKNMHLMDTIIGSFYAWTYEILDEDGVRLDNATIAEASQIRLTCAADKDNVFTDKRYIRLLCEYKTTDVKNETHILWHMQQAYRDPSLKGIESDHIRALKDSLNEEDEKWNKTWSDGSTLADVLNPASSASKALSTAVVPKKEES